MQVSKKGKIQSYRGPRTTLAEDHFFSSMCRAYPRHGMASIFPLLFCDASIDLSAAGVLPEEILDRRLVKKGNASQLKVLIKWATIPVSSAT